MTTRIVESAETAVKIITQQDLHEYLRAGFTESLMCINVRTCEIRTKLQQETGTSSVSIRSRLIPAGVRNALPFRFLSGKNLIVGTQTIQSRIQLPGPCTHSH